MEDREDLAQYYSIIRGLATIYNIATWKAEYILSRCFTVALEATKKGTIISLETMLEIRHRDIHSTMRRWAHRFEVFQQLISNRLAQEQLSWFKIN